MKSFRLKQWIFFFAGVAIFALGIFSLLRPVQTVLLTTVFVSAAMFVKGVSNMSSFFRKKSGQTASGLALFGALIDIIFGVILLLNRDTSAIVFCLIVGFWFLVSSVFGISRSFEYKALGYRQWWLSLVFSIISTILALMIVGNPIFGGIIITYFVAISLISTGIVIIAGAFSNGSASEA